MARRRRQVAAASLPFEASSQPGLRLHAAGDRLAALLAQRERLLAEVRKRKAALRAATEEAESAAREMVSQMAPMIAKFDAAREEIGTLFRELLAPGRLAARTRNKVLRVYRSLVAQGLIAERSVAEDDAGEEPFDDRDPSRDHFEFDPSEFSRHESEPRVAPAPQHGQTPGRESLRTLFRRLALALHPDRTQNEGDRELRTEAMKEATRAYEDGDLARLLELEKAWQDGTVARGAVNDEGRRCEELERTIRELTRQSRELSRELRDVKRRALEDMLDVPPESVVAQAEDELKDLELIREFVKGYRDGKLTLAEFLRGPQVTRTPEELELEQLLGDMLQEQTRPSRSRPKRRRRSR